MGCKNKIKTPFQTPTAGLEHKFVVVLKRTWELFNIEWVAIWRMFQKKIISGKFIIREKCTGGVEFPPLEKNYGI